ncbi:MAG: translocation/assembly module TamB domain-containing protein [Saprospiraceae bacterium]|nr:translocation/assembly module TamB domain-containing protein [Candidatus Brachybacter algidus]
MTAIYIANVPPLDLISNQLSTANQTIRNTYKQRLPFEINLNMEGQLLKPIITFDIKLPTNKNYGVSNDVISTTNTRLTQLRQEPAELNKQVFAALLLNRFVGDNPFAAESGGFTGERFARQSVSKILTEQLNNLAANMIAGIDLNFDINSTEDYSSGELQNRTDLTVGLSKDCLMKD